MKRSLIPVVLAAVLVGCTANPDSSSTSPTPDRTSATMSLSSTATTSMFGWVNDTADKPAKRMRRARPRRQGGRGCSD